MFKYILSVQRRGGCASHITHGPSVCVFLHFLFKLIEMIELS